jgi:hypothetical protein
MYLLAVASVGCGVIPSAYRGNFVDSNTGATLSLTGTSGVFQTESKTYTDKATDLKYENLLQGKPGIYVAMSPGDRNELEVYWLAPDFATAQQAAGIMWFQSDVIQTLVDRNQKQKVREIELTQCTGTVMLDLVNKNWQVGCPADPTHYLMRRVDKK